jgi:prephenate dehydrogenase
MTVGVIGLGLIGGSMALDLKRRGFASHTLGTESDPVAAEAAGTIGLVDEVVDLDTLVARSDIIVLAVPVGTAVSLLPSILDRVGGTPSPYTCPGVDKPVGGSSSNPQIVIDVCSTKEAVCRAVENHPARGRFVSTHPMAGTEYSGPWAAQPGLFDGRACIFCDAEKSDPEAVAEIDRLYAALNMRILQMPSAQHDMHAAYVSHISHVTSFALALTVLDKEKDEKHIFDLASGGFSSTVRLAKSNPDMWVPILTQNKDNILQVMDTYIEKMQAFREAVAAEDQERIRQLIEEANHIKKILR